MRLHALPWLLLVLLLAGCPHPLWLPDRNLKENLSDADVVGEWRLTAESLELLKRDGFKPADAHRYLITLLKDGTCTFQTVLDRMPEPAVYHEATGKWKLAPATDRDAKAKRKNALSLELKINGGYNTGFGFDRKNKALLLWTHHGDPDSWEFIEYQKP